MTADLAARLTPRTDKFTLGYYPAYAQIAAEIGPAGYVLEVGVDAGGSMLMWQALFPSGLVAGVDSDPAATWPSGTAKIVASQEDPAIAAAARELSPDGWDLVVDDASHLGWLSEATFGLLWPLVKPGRWYVLEDWTVSIAEPFAGIYGNSMLRLAESFISMLGPGSDIDTVTYRYGQAILQKKPA